MLANRKDLAMYHTEDYLRFVLDPDTSCQGDTVEHNTFGLEEVSPVMLSLSGVCLVHRRVAFYRIVRLSLA